MNSSHSFVTEGTPGLREAEVKRPHRSLRPHYAKIIDFSGRDRVSVAGFILLMMTLTASSASVARADIKKL